MLLAVAPIVSTSFFEVNFTAQKLVLNPLVSDLKLRISHSPHHTSPAALQWVRRRRSPNQQRARAARLRMGKAIDTVSSFIAFRGREFSPQASLPLSTPWAWH